MTVIGREHGANFVVTDNRHVDQKPQHARAEGERFAQALRSLDSPLVREVRGAIAANDARAAAEHLARAERALGKAVTKGVLHRNNTSRRISRLARAVTRLAAAGR